MNPNQHVLALALIATFSAVPVLRSSQAQTNQAQQSSSAAEDEADLKKEFESYQRGAEQGLVEAQFNLAGCYQYGRGCEVSLTKAFEWYQRAADNGCPEAQTYLGFCYMNGTGIEVDPTKTVTSFQRAAKQNYAVAQFNLALCYQYGYGVTADQAKAIELYQLAADQGDPDAQFTLGGIYAHDTKAATQAQAVQLYEAAAKQGHVQAQQELKALHTGKKVAEENRALQRSNAAENAKLLQLSSNPIYNMGSSSSEGISSSTSMQSQTTGTVPSTTPVKYDSKCTSTKYLCSDLTQKAI